MGMGMLGAMGGLGEAGAAVGKELMAGALEKDKVDYLTQKQAQLREVELRLAQKIKDEERQGQADRISKEQSGMLQSAIGQKYAGSDAAVAAADAGQTDMPLTQEQRDVIAQSKAKDMANPDLQAKTFVQAAIKTGDINPTDAAKLQQKDDATLYKVMWEQAREDRKDERLDKRLQAVSDNLDKRLAAGSSKSGSGGSELGQAKFDSKEWHSATNDLGKFADVDNPANPEKPKRNLAASKFIADEMSRLRAVGEDPYGASTAVSNRLMALRDRAESAVKANPKLSMDEALSIEVKAYTEARRKAEGSINAPDQASDTSAKPKVEKPSGMLSSVLPQKTTDSSAKAPDEWIPRGTGKDQFGAYVEMINKGTGEVRRFKPSGGITGDSLNLLRKLQQ